LATNVIMPQLGETVVEGTISRWLVQEGDVVGKNESLLEISTDKVDTEVPAPETGTLLKIYFSAGETVQAGTVIAIIGQPQETVPDKAGTADRRAHPAQEVEPSVSSAPGAESLSPAAPAVGRDLGSISPVVARIAREHNVDLAQVPGTGRAGRIRKQDVLAFIEVRDRAARGVPAEPGPTAQTLVPHSRIRRLIAEHMVLSKGTSAHVTTVMEADMSTVVAHRAAHKNRFAAQGVNLTFTPYFIQATIAGLKSVPQVNALYQEDGLLVQNRYHIGMATAIPDGLLVPVIRDADGYSLLDLTRQVVDLAQRARSGRLKPDEVQGSTFTITNHGASGSLFATPIINQPNVGILGLGAIQKRAVVVGRGHPIEPSSEDAIAIRPMVYLSFAFDHRALDGEIADKFLTAVKQALEQWA
jgi:2-oxoglutarate dehydrogenase E2 component (dihydrolipoamide succinyltransferase)